MNLENKFEKIGVDFSLNSPAFCFMNNDQYFFKSYVNNSVLTKSDKLEIDIINDTCDNIDIVTFDKGKYSDENAHTKELIRIVDLVFDDLQTIVIPNYKVIFEGFSFMSKSSSLYQFAGSNYYLRERFIKNGNEIFVESPGHVKKYAGKGNAKKDEMIEFFLKHAGGSDFKKYLNNYWKNRTTKKIMKPLDDIVDSYFVGKCFNI